MSRKVRLIIGLVYGLLLEFWSLCALGVGHGTTLPMFVSFSPVSLIGFLEGIESLESTPPGWLTPVFLIVPALVWVLVALLLPDRSHRRTLVFLVLMAAHYAGVVFVVFQFRGDTGGSTEPTWMAGWVFTYLLGQVTIWAAFMQIHFWSGRREL